MRLHSFPTRRSSDQPRLLQDPEALSHVLREKLLWIVAAAVILLGLYLLVDTLGRRLARRDSRS